MRRWFLSVAVLLSAALYAQAEYIRITYFLGASKNRAAQIAAAFGRGGPGGPGGPGMSPPARGQPGGPGGGRGRRGPPGGGGGGPSRRRRPGAGRRPGGPTLLMDDIDDPNMLRAEAVIEYTREDTEKFIQRPISIFPRIWHKWGRTGITKTPDILFTPIRENGLPLPPVADAVQGETR